MQKERDKVREPLILTFDCGTQSARCMLFNKRGEIRAFSKVEFTPYISEHPGWAEREPDFYWEQLKTAAKQVRKEHPELIEDVLAITLTTMRDTVVNLDKDYRPLRPAILWLDQRQVACKKPLPAAYRLAYRAVGMTEAVEASRACTKSNWIRENQPEIWEKTDKYVLLSCYLIYKMTGNLVDSVASQVGHIPLDYKNKRGMTPNQLKFPIFNVEPEKLPPLVEPGEVLGKLTRQAAEEMGLKEGLKVIATGSDKGCETIGTGCIDESRGSLSFGTTSTIQLTTSRYVEPQQFLPAYPSVMPGMYNPEIEIYRGYWMITWFKNEFAQEERQEALRRGVSPEFLLDQHLHEVPPGSDGLMLQPYWGAGLKNPEAKGAIIGFTDVHTRVHIYRAIIEGVNYALRDGLETVSNRAKIQVKELTVSGGGSGSDVICQITADMFGMDILRAQTSETSGLGSSIIGFLGLHEFSSMQEAVSQMVQHTSVFHATKEGSEIYDQLFQVYKGVYPRLKPLYHKLRDIYH